MQNERPYSSQFPPKVFWQLASLCIVIGIGLFIAAGAVCLAVYAKPVEQRQSDQFLARTISFPTTYSFGDICVVTPHVSCNEWAKRQSRNRLAYARGMVKVPAGTAVRLYILYDGGLNVAPLDDVKANDIQSLDLTRVDMHKDTGKYVSHLTGLKELSASDTEAGDDFVHYLAPLKNLQCLTMNRTQITDKGLEDVAQLGNLTVLGLDSNLLGDKGIAKLAKLKSLKSLQLEKSNLTDAGLKSLESMPNLHCLKINDTRITDAGLTSIAKISSLTDLEIAGTPVHGEGLAALSKLHQLRSLRVSWKTVDANAVSSLQKALPHCNISNDGKRMIDSWVPLMH